MLASPLYYWTLSGQIRTAFDRLFAVAECEQNYLSPKKNAVLLMVAGGNDFEDAVSYYQSFIKHLHWNDLGRVLAGGVTAVGNIMGKPALEEARKLGASIA